MKFRLNAILKFVDKFLLDIRCVRAILFDSQGFGYFREQKNKQDLMNSRKPEKSTGPSCFCGGHYEF